MEEKVLPPEVYLAAAVEGADVSRTANCIKCRCLQQTEKDLFRRGYQPGVRKSVRHSAVSIYSV